MTMGIFWGIRAGWGIEWIVGRRLEKVRVVS